MYSQSILQDIMRFEMAMGPSHECHDCGSTFLANSDRCSNCGSYRIKTLHSLEVEREVWNMETYPIMYWDREVGYHRIHIGDFSSWPKV
jgi:uncharacterized OB-fold protein